jgi:hypothetical protein
VPPNTLFRKDAKLTVNMSADFDVAEPKTEQKLSEPEAHKEVPANIQKPPQKKTNPAKRKAANNLLAKSFRAKATFAQPDKAAGQVLTPTPTPTPAPNLAIWDHDSDIKKRIEQLKIRNAQLAEQLQRLPSTAKA